MPHRHWNIDPDARLFTGRGSAVYDRLSPVVMGWLYNRVAADVAAAKPTGLVVDLGCGPGHATVRIARENPAVEVVGLDPSPDMIHRARANAESAGVSSHLRFEVGDSGGLPFADSSVGLIVSSLSVHHWEDVPAGLVECLRVLRPGAEFWIYEPDLLMGRAVQRTVRRQARALIPEPSVRRNVIRLGPLPLMARMRLRRPPAD